MPALLRHISEALVGDPLETPGGDITVDPDVLDQSLEADVVVLGPDEAQDQQVERRAVEVARERVQDVDLHRPYRVLVVRVVPDAQHRRVDLDGRCAGLCAGRRGRRCRG